MGTELKRTTLAYLNRLCKLQSIWTPSTIQVATGQRGSRIVYNGSCLNYSTISYPTYIVAVPVVARCRLLIKAGSSLYMLATQLQNRPRLVVRWHYKKSVIAGRVELESSGAVWKSRWPSWAPVPSKPTVSVDVKQHFNQINQREDRFIWRLNRKGSCLQLSK